MPPVEYASRFALISQYALNTRFRGNWLASSQRSASFLCRRFDLWQFFVRLFGFHFCGVDLRQFLAFWLKERRLVTKDLIPLCLWPWFCFHFCTILQFLSTERVFLYFQFFFVFSDLISVERRRSEAVFGLCSLCGEKGGSRLGQAGGTWWGSKCYSQVEIHCST